MTERAENKNEIEETNLERDECEIVVILNGESMWIE